MQKCAPSSCQFAANQTTLAGTVMSPDTGHHTPDTGHRTQDAGHRTQDTVGVIYDTAIFYHYLIILAVSGRSAREIFFLGEDWQSKGCARSKVDRIWRT